MTGRPLTGDRSWEERWDAARAGGYRFAHFDELPGRGVVLLRHDVDLSLLQAVPDLEVEDGVVVVNDSMMTSYPGIFAGGDMVPSERTDWRASNWPAAAPRA